MRPAALALALLAAGCLTSTYRTGRPWSGVDRTEHAPFYLWGLVGEKSVDLKQLCPEGVASWSDQQTFEDGLLECLTCGIYSPRTIVVHCAGGPAYQLQPGQSVTWVRPLAPDGVAPLNGEGGP